MSIPEQAVLFDGFDPQNPASAKLVDGLRGSGYAVAEPGETWLSFPTGPNLADRLIAGTVTGVAERLRDLGYRVVEPRRYQEDRSGRARTGDHETSKAGARSVRHRAGTQIHLLLRVYADAADGLMAVGVSDKTARPAVGHHPSAIQMAVLGLTDEEAAWAACRQRGCWWRRCGEMRDDGLIAFVFDGDLPVTRPGSSGVPRQLCRITEAGRVELALRDGAA